MIGYKDKKHIWIGWFASRLDTLVNFIPARLVAVTIGIIAVLHGQQYSRFREIVAQYKDKTDSVNAGWPLSAIAAILNVRLEKPGFYQIGPMNDKLSWSHIYEALKIMRLTTGLTILIIVIPIIVLMECLPL